MAKMKRSLRTALARQGLTFTEWVAFVEVTYRPKPSPSMVNGIWGELRMLQDKSLSRQHAKLALHSCLQKGLLRIITEADLSEIVRVLEENRLAGPAYGLPRVGDVDFTTTGAECYLRIMAEIDPEGTFILESYPQLTETGESLFCPTYTAAEKDASYCRSDPEVSRVSEPIPLGPWCVYWWHRFPSGYRVDIEKNRAGS